MNKHYLLLSAGLLLSGAAHAQGTELFFSEYDEGAHQSGVNYGGATNSTGSERALEIYNPTTSTVNLNPYSVRRYANGSATPTEEERLFRSDANQVSTGANTMVPRSTFVLASGEATLPVIRTRANQFSVGHAPTTGPTVITGGGVAYFNGDDAVALVRYPSGTAGTGTGVIIDIIGVIGVQPAPSGSGGTGNWSGTNPIDGTPAVYVSSANQSIVRRASVSAGTRVNPTQTSYNIADQWMTYSTAFNGPGGTSNPGGQLYDQLGQHNDYAGPYGTYQTTISSTLAKFNANISVYPNPAHGTATVDIKDAKVGTVTVINNLGQRISAQAKGAGQEKLTLDVSALKPGLYFVQIYSADGQTKIYKELVVQ
ncbi:T9SS type A sorting domain-containing protein [Hymenobacter properus]|uniref:T9SS type A sorting domain-containing protein n=1 Tax=Hymenobacter properus TaxID=2791026 RepID=A0A931FIE9_9BACT|nr:T9SS type A sorting domain-containing protein [Hymenobacter properus]MBF9140713.1 T9SS type A sorting domain-containing protein [Hymenobacter properus]MBR7719521.1 T9SS type A sorting domain-containing protein [Microvirga sp. SRT04]